MRLIVARFFGEIPNRYCERQVFAQGVPPQVALRKKLLHMLWRGAAGSRLVEPATCQQWHN